MKLNTFKAAFSYSRRLHKIWSSTSFTKFLKLPLAIIVLLKINANKIDVINNELCNLRYSLRNKSNIAFVVMFLKVFITIFLVIIKLSEFHIITGNSIRRQLGNYVRDFTFSITHNRQPRLPYHYSQPLINNDNLQLDVNEPGESGRNVIAIVSLPNYAKIIVRDNYSCNETINMAKGFIPTWFLHRYRNSFFKRFTNGLLKVRKCQKYL